MSSSALSAIGVDLHDERGAVRTGIAPNLAPSAVAGLDGPRLSDCGSATGSCCEVAVPARSERLSA